MITKLTKRFKTAIQENNMSEMKNIIKHYQRFADESPDFFIYNCMQVAKLNELATNLTATKIQEPAPVPSWHIPDTLGWMKLPKLDIPTWSGETFKFYNWLSSCQNLFNLTSCSPATKTQIMFQALPLNKNRPFLGITDWDKLFSRLEQEFGSIQEFGHSVSIQFQHLTPCSTRREVAETLAPMVRRLSSTIANVRTFKNNPETLKITMLSATLNQSIINCLPRELGTHYLEKLSEFTQIDKTNNRPDLTFYFIVDYLSKIEKGYKINSIEFNYAFAFLFLCVVILKIRGLFFNLFR